VPLYGDGRNERDWLYVEDHCSAIHLLVDEGTPGEVYNIGANAQLANIDLTGDPRRPRARTSRGSSGCPTASDTTCATRSTPQDPGPGLGPGAPDFEERLADTIDWYRTREDWWRPLKEGPA
jgi:dTDP-glucose 4,6-dehydratase